MPQNDQPILNLTSLLVIFLSQFDNESSLRGKERLFLVCPSRSATQPNFKEVCITLRPPNYELCLIAVANFATKSVQLIFTGFQQFSQLKFEEINVFNFFHFVGSLFQQEAAVEKKVLPRSTYSLSYSGYTFLLFYCCDLYW